MYRIGAGSERGLIEVYSMHCDEPVNVHVYVHTDDTTALSRKLDIIMADLAALESAVAQLLTDDVSVVAALNDLAGKVAAGDPISQADIDAITAKVTGVSADIQAAIATDDPAPVAPPAD